MDVGRAVHALWGYDNFFASQSYAFHHSHIPFSIRI